MQTILLETRIAAPAMRVFLLSLSVDLHTASAEQTGERAIAGTTSGLMGLGDMVTWQGRHFGLMLRQTARITAYSPPDCFEDTMVEGLFASFRHVHRFKAEAGGTWMQDELVFQAPFGVAGMLAERLVLRNHLSRFVAKRNELLRQVAESQAWMRYIPPSLQHKCA